MPTTRKHFRPLHQPGKRGGRPRVHVIQFDALINGYPVSATLDTGATITCINEAVLKALHLQIMRNSCISVQQVTSSTKTLGRVNLKVQIGKVTREIQAHVLQGMKSNLLLGLDSACLFNLSLDLDTMTLRQGKDILHSRTQNQTTVNKGASLQGVEVCDVLHLNKTQQLALKQLIHKYDDIFSKSQTDIGCINGEMHRIHLNNNVPIRRAPYRCSETDSVEMDRQINELLKQGVIRLSTSPYAAPALLAEKKGEGRTRFCIDYRKLNELTVPDYQPIPRIDDVLDSLGKLRTSRR